jgi:hypothetical protein
MSIVAQTLADAIKANLDTEFGESDWDVARQALGDAIGGAVAASHNADAPAASWKTIGLDADDTIPNAATQAGATAVDDLGIAVAANATVRFRFYLIVTLSNSAAALQVSFGGPLTPTFFIARSIMWPGDASGYAALQQVTSYTAEQGASGGTGPYLVTLEGVIRNAGNTGTPLVPKVRSNGYTGAVKAGSWVEYL